MTDDRVTEETRMTAILDAAQIEALPKNPPERGDAVAYCNAAINSGLGALERYYESNEYMADLAILSVLAVWVMSVEKRLSSREKRAAE